MCQLRTLPDDLGLLIKVDSMEELELVVGPTRFVLFIFFMIWGRGPCGKDLSLISWQNYSHKNGKKTGGGGRL